MIVVLGILGITMVRSVRTDVVHSSRDSGRVRAELAAESAAQWALLELSRRRAGRFPFTLATHDSDGSGRMGKPPVGPGSDRYTGPWPISAADLVPFPGAHISIDKDGWIAMRNTSSDRNISGGDDEELTFKAWYPDDSTLRVTGKSRVDGSQASIEVVAKIGHTPLPP